MSDDPRTLERAWRASGADGDGAAYLEARLARGELRAEDVRVLARLGLGAALAQLGDDAPETVPLDGRGFDGLCPGEPRLLRLAFVRSWERHFLPGWEASHPGDPRGRALVVALLEAAAHPRPAALPAPALDLPGLDREHAQALRGLVQADPRKLLLEHALPPAALAVPRVVVVRELHATMAAELLGVSLPAGAVREHARARLVLVTCADAPLEVVQRTAAWLDGLSTARPRPLRLSVATARPSFTTLAATLEALGPEVSRRGPHDFVQLVTLRRDAQDWFARHLDADPRASVVHLGEQARVKLEASPEAFLAHFVAKKALDGVLGAAAPRHEPSRGCAFDFCAVKKELDARIRAGGVCRECDVLLRRQPRLPEAHLAGLLAILAAARERMLAAR